MSKPRFNNDPVKQSTYTIKPLPGKTYKHKQSKYPDTPEVPFRMLINAPSASGKSVLLQSMLTDAYADCFDAGLHIWSQSIWIDDLWKPVIKHMEERGFAPEKYCHDKYVESELEAILAEQKSVIQYQKSKKHTFLFGLCLCFDDMLDDVKLMRHSRQLEVLFCRARHLGISTVVSSQKFRVLNPCCRINSTDEIVFRLRSQMDLNAWIEESSALADPRTILDLYHRAVSVPYQFLWLKKVAKDPNDIFHIGFAPGEKIV